MGVSGLVKFRGFNQGIPVAEKAYLFKELYIQTIIRNPKKVGLFGYR